VPVVSDVSGVEKDPLIYAILKGLSGQAAAAAAAALETEDALAVIDGKIIPALDRVGQGFEKGSVFLPQLLMSAEAAQSAFEVIKDALAIRGEASERKGRIVLATVRGDIHDIGKNIIKILLENYGYDVLDLGRDVPVEIIVDTAVRARVKLVGLSALMTTTVPAMEETIKALRKNAPACRVVVGGAVLNREYADMIGADKYAKDAMETVRYAGEVFGRL
jgi:5-methyltetrahydrofolate--homocysteine methyltransferase